MWFSWVYNSLVTSYLKYIYMERKNGYMSQSQALFLGMLIFWIYIRLVVVYLVPLVLVCQHNEGNSWSSHVISCLWINTVSAPWWSRAHSTPHWRRTIPRVASRSEFFLQQIMGSIDSAMLLETTKCLNVLQGEIAHATAPQAHVLVVSAEATTFHIVVAVRYYDEYMRTTMWV